MSDEDASDFQAISTCPDGLACRLHVHNKSCVSDLWNFENDTRDILAISCQDDARVGRIHEDVTRMLRGCYKETAHVKFRL